MTLAPDLPKPARAVALGHAPPWGQAARTIAGRRRTGLVMLAGSAVLLVAIWTVPPMLDWGRFRGTIASIAAARLGRPVSIGGEVTLRLLPRAVLTAGDVTLPDQGDGVSATIASLRLEVGVVPLLAGRLVPRDLVLGIPVLRLPWPLPETLATPSRPRVPRAFAAHLDNGTLLIGGARVQGINAALHSAPDAPAGFGAASAEPGAQGFGAEGFAAFAGRSWRFTTALGAPDADGVSAVDLSVSGQGPAARTDATLQGTLADGVLQGRLVAGGPDLSLLMPASAGAWRVEAPFVADGARITTPSLSLSLGGSPTDGALTLRLTRPAQLEGRLHAASIDLDGWARALPARLAATRAAMPGLSGQVGLSADRATLLGGALTALRGTLASDGAALALRDGEAVLPGDARLSLSGTITGAADGVRISGPARLDAPALRTTLAWLRPLAPALADVVPDGVLTRARLDGEASIAPSTLSIARLSGEIDGEQVTGGVGASLGPRVRLGLGFAISRLALDAWLAALWPAQAPNLPTLAKAAARLDTDIHLRVRTASWRGQDVSGLVLDGQTGTGGLMLQQASFDISGAHVTASGAMAPDGTVAGGALHIAAPGPSGLASWLPRDWRWAAPAWQGEASLHATLAGPAHDLAVEVRADAGDLVLEADGRADPDVSRAAGSVTVRHPGAPRLLAALGVTGAERWLGTGSFAVRAQVAMTPDRVSIDEFDLRAADLGLRGHLKLDRAGADPSWTGTMSASTLALPGMDQADGLWPNAVNGQVAQIGVTSEEVSVGGRDIAHDVSAQVSLSHGAGLIDIAHASAWGGQASGLAAFVLNDGRTSLAIQGNLIDADATALAPGLPVSASAGRADLSVDVASDGRSGWPSRLFGQAGAKLRNISLAGFDLGRVGEALSERGRAARAALLSALSQGDTASLSGTLSASFAHGVAQLAPAQLVSQDGSVNLSGSADIAARNLDLLFGLAPDGVASSGVGVRLSGLWTAARAQPTLGPTVTHPARRGRPH